ncbi:methionine import ATP-binding protein MetN 3 [Polycladomyces abyssicola]|jgi:D-methionine transport system ATP-binding protein|uniref:Methionine import ATP-binding protein MetN 3 n=1 Tax=Polycladomyces abyssicola TaxID=1125966 RepID=A0A8D5ZNY7_9BACL|nr:ATP-binding cassette domain-containing protein [Polycladomyces abyssicola]BCU83220.1 methionine import ATP-binding protein MetN 3 [Polycladomyces abyssicola]
MIVLDKVNKVYPSSKDGDVVALQDINLRIERGEIFGIVGHSGAGKSTLLRLLNGLEKPTSGSVTVDGISISESSERELREARKKIGMIFQHFHLLWSRTVWENVAFPLELAGKSKKEIREKVDSLLERVGLSHRANAYPAQLSGGQKQRVGIARALANDPSVLLCDEATSALDPETTASILQLLKDIHRDTGITMVIITHEMSVVKRLCHRMAVMEAGKVVELGEVETLFREPKHPVTQQFVQSYHTEKLEASKEHADLIRVRSDDLDRIWSRLADWVKQGVTVTILPDQEENDGTVALQVSGEPYQVRNAVEEIREFGGRSEVITHV